jgi:hypothetical protein
MSEPENFIARWSRRKRAAQDTDAAKAEVAPAAADQSTQDSGRGASETVKRDEQSPISGAEPPLDLSKLPPLESIVADTDIRAFLAPGVPPDLARAALRRAWLADPTIRDFVGLSENAWDFNAPDAVPGFGSLEMTDELRRQITQMVGRGVAAIEPDGAEEPVRQASVETTGETSPATAESPRESNREIPPDQSVNSDASPHNLSHIDQVYGATQHSPAKSSDDQLAVKRSHGRALPK